MPYNELLKRLLPHVSSVSLSLLAGILFLFGGSSALEPYLPKDSEPHVIFILIVLVLVYELAVAGHRTLRCEVVCVGDEVKGIAKQVEISRLIHSVNVLYTRFIDSGDEWITHEYTIKELADLTDLRKKLMVNSYIQGKLEFLNSKIKRV